MNDLQKPVRQAQHRLWLNRWLSTLGWSVAAAAGLFVVAVLVQRLWVVAIDAGRFFGIVATSLGGAALVASVIWAAITREGLTQSAAALDVAANLKERLSTGLFCRELADPFARAVVADAQQASRGLAVKRHLPVQPPRSASYAGVGLLVALLMFLLFPRLDLAGAEEQAREEQERARRVEHAQAVVRPLVEKRLEDLRKKNPTVKDELEKLEPVAEAKLTTPLDVRRETMKKLEKLTDKLEDKKSDSELAKVDAFKNMLRRLAAVQPSKSPVGELSKALSKGDFKNAQKALDQLKLELSKAPKSEEEKRRAEELKKQLDKVAKKIEQAAQDQSKNERDLSDAGLNQQEVQRALEQLNKKDLESVAKKLGEKGLSQKQIDKLMQKMQQRGAAGESASQLAQSLAQAGQAAQGSEGSGQMSQSAAQALSAAGQQLSDMEALEQQMNELNAALSGLDTMKNDLGQGCSMCNGTGMKDGQPCPGCQGSGMNPGTGQGGQGGMGKLGRGRGNIAPEQETAYKTTPEKTPVNTRRGAIISTQFVDGEQFKGEASREFVETAVAAERDVTDAIAREQIPRSYHGPIKEYFTRSISDLPADEVEAAENKNPPESP